MVLDRSRTFAWGLEPVQTFTEHARRIIRKAEAKPAQDPAGLESWQLELVVPALIAVDQYVKSHYRLKDSVTQRRRQAAEAALTLELMAQVLRQLATEYDVIVFGRGRASGRIHELLKAWNWPMPEEAA